MRRWNRRNPGGMVAVLLGALALLGSGRTVLAQAEVGDPLPELKVELVDGTALTIGTEEGRLLARRGATIERPKAIAIHFLQPDCLQCRAQLRTLEDVRTGYAAKGVLVVGIAHRGGLADVKALQRELGLGMTIGTARSDVRALAAGDASMIADGTGTLRFTQVGFAAGDEELWREVLDALLAGHESPHESVTRRRLKAGDRFPSISLDSLTSGKPTSLRARDGRLELLDDRGATTKPRAVLFFFSRY